MKSLQQQIISCAGLRREAIEAGDTDRAEALEEVMAELRARAERDSTLDRLRRASPKIEPLDRLGDFDAAVAITAASPAAQAELRQERHRAAYGE